MMMMRALALLCLAAAVGGCTSLRGDVELREDDPRAAPREFRGVWVATVANIDWPSEPGLPRAEAQAEVLAILDRAAALNLNAVILQVRPAGDALYDSPYEPWSEFLTGAIAQPPDQPWDPLAFAVEQAHARGLQLHAWVNPFRVRHPANDSPPSGAHVAVTRPDLVRAYGPYLWLDPGEPEARAHSLRVMLDIVDRYDVDGIHLDDYFYPYPRSEHGRELPFPDDASYARYVEQGGGLTRADWRRRNVDDFVRRLYREVKNHKPHVLVSISPFGIYRPGEPGYVRGFDQYAQLYADPRKWLREGWLDALVPQLYWPIAPPQQSFVGLLRWWDGQNTVGRHVWPGLAVYRHAERPADYPVSEFVHQVEWSRILTSTSDGHVHFSAKWLMPGAAENEALAEGLREGVYGEAAVWPASPWLGRSAAGEVRITSVTVVDGRLRVEADADSLASARWWVVRIEQAGRRRTVVRRAAQPVMEADVHDGEPVVRVVAYALSPAGVAGPISERSVKINAPAP